MAILPVVIVAFIAIPLAQTAFATGGSVYAWGYNSFGECNVPAGLNNAVAVQCGNYFSMALRANGTVATWGDNGFGLLDVPASATNVMAISSRGYDCLVLRRDGTLVTWGGGQVSIPTSATGIVAIATGGGHHLALRQDGELLAWGANNYGQCNIPLEATNIVAIDAGYTHSLVLRKDGRVLAWGENLGGTTNVPPEATNIVAIACGPDFNLALRADHTVVAWGLDWGGNLPVPGTATNVVGISAGESPDFAIRADGSVVAWGRNDNGELTVPGGLFPAFTIGAGNFHSLGIRVVGGVTLPRQPEDRIVSAGDSILFNVPAIGQVPISYQWRFNTNPLPGEISPVLLLPDVQGTNGGSYDVVVQNGYGAVTSQVAVVTVLPAKPTIKLQSMGQVASLGGSANFWVRAKGTEPLYYQWLRNGTNMVGETNPSLFLTNVDFSAATGYRVIVTNAQGQVSSTDVPLEVVPVFAWGTDSSGVLDLPFGLTNVTALAAGPSHNLALKADGTVIGWGDNSYNESTALSTETNWMAVAAGGGFSLGLRKDGSAVAYGNTYGIPGDATNVVSISAGPPSGLLLRSDGTLVAWGLSPPADATNLIAVAAGGSQGLGLRNDGVVIGWGNNNRGQAVPPSSATNVIAIAAGDYFSLSLRADGTLLAWGDNSLGQTTVPLDATNIIWIAAGGSHGLAAREDGRLFVWGDTSAGQGLVPAALKFPTLLAAGSVHDLALEGTGRLLFARQPLSQKTTAGDPTFLYAAAVGQGPVTYQWLRDGTNVSGATHAYLTMVDTQTPDEGRYSFVVSNNFGSITSAVAQVTVAASPPVVMQQPKSQLATTGGQASFAVLAKGTEPISYQWRLNGMNVPDATAPTLNIGNTQWTNTGTYDVVLSNSVGITVSSAATLTFQPTVDSFDLGINNFVYAMAPQADGKVLVGGSFTSLGGQFRTNLARLNVDGTLDSTFNPALGSSSTVVYGLANQPDGRILVGGHFNSVSGQSRTNLARLNPDGTLDTSFNTSVMGSWVSCIAFQADGKIVLGGAFTSILGQPRTNLARLNPDGMLDVTFNPGAIGGSVFSLAVQADGRIVVGGVFTTLAGQPRSNIGRINADGSIDATFNPGTPGGVNSLVVQPDARILVGGGFATIGGQNRNHLARLNADGTLDSLFNPGADGIVYSLALQANGKVLAGGAFTSLSGQPCNYIGRLNGDGSLDPAFSLGADSTVYGLALQADGRILAGGYFSNFGGQPRTRLARVSNTEPATSSLAVDASTITWSRGGSSPEVERATFDISTNGNDWLSLGAGSYNSGAWQLSNTVAPSNVTFRARGYASAGYQNGSTWFTENGLGPPAVSFQPASQTNLFGTMVTFSVQAAGTQPFAYQWQKDGSNLDDGGNIFGAHSPFLSLFSVSGAARAGYSVVISNTSGIVTSLVARLEVVDPLITQPPVSQVVTAGQTAVFSVTATGTTPLNYQWRKYGTNLVGATSASLTLTNIQWSDGGSYDVLVSNQYSTNSSKAATLAFLATPDSLNPAPNGPVFSLAVQPDSKILLGGSFSGLGGQVRLNIARLLPNGAVDTGFNPAAGGSVFALAVQADGRVLIGGAFPTLGGQSRTCLGRIYPDGSLDSDFNPSPNTNVNALAVQADGKIVVAGTFTNLYGQPRSFIGRLNWDGTLDTAFNPTVSGPVNSVSIQPDGRMILGGAFTNLCGQPRSFVGRLNPDGTLDDNFSSPANSNVYCLLSQPDGKTLVGGSFTTLCGQTCMYVGRVNGDGSLDTTFNPVANSTVYSLALQTDGKILVGGNFTSLGAQTRRYIGRLNPDGTLDSTFNPNPSSFVYALALQSDGSILAGGNFSTLAGQTRSRLARLNNTYPALEQLASDGASITWTRNGASPEVWRSIFEFSTNGSSWTTIGTGSRIPGGWRVPADGLPANPTIFARGYIAEGYQAGSAWFVESGLGPPAIRIQPTSRTNNAATVATFGVTATGTLLLGCQWFKDGFSLSDGGNISGARSFNLTVSNVLRADAAGYYAVITNNYGSVTSLVASLSIVDPYIARQPASRTNNAGTTATFSVQAAGTSLSYQWFKGLVSLADGGNISGAHSGTLTLSNVLGADMGGYSVIVTNTLGSLTSSVANLTVVDPYISTQPVSQSVSPWQMALFSVTVAGTAPGFQWRHAGVPLPGASARSLVITNAQQDDAGLYDVVVSNAFGMITSTVAMLTVNFVTADSLNPGANSTVNTVAVQPDGKILVGGSFSMLGSQARSCAGRVNVDGTLDNAFAPEAVGNDGVYCFAPRPDGWILMGGGFLSLGNQSQHFYGRVDYSGSLDPSFSLGANGWVSCLLPLADGTILMSGGFGTLGNQGRACLARLNPDGTLDPSFNPGANYSVLQLAVQADGKILACGAFTALGGAPHNFIARLNADGTLDNSFNPAGNGTIFCLALQPDGKIVIGGAFTLLNSQSRNYIGRLNSDGTIDDTFNPGANDFVQSLVLQADGKMIVGGRFTLLGGQVRNRLGRLSNDGSLDATFDPGTDNAIHSLALQPDGSIVVGGTFGLLGGQARTNFGRLKNPAPATQTLTYDGSTLSWLRGGSSPEVWRTSFDASADGTNWIALGQGTRIPGGWQVTNVSVPISATVRLRGFVLGAGYYNASSTYVQTQAKLQPLMLPNSSKPFGATILAAAGQPVLIEASTNLVQWNAIQTNLITSGGLVLFTDPDSALFPYRFYRARYYSGPLPRPSISIEGEPLELKTSGFVFKLLGVPGQTLVIEASTNFLNWEALATNTLPTTPLYFKDLGSSNYPVRFYRARVP